MAGYLERLAAPLRKRRHPQPTVAAPFKDMLAVLDHAARIEPDRARVFRWYAEEPIRDLDYRTAAEVVRAGEVLKVLSLLRRIEAAELRSAPGHRLRTVPCR